MTTRPADDLEEHFRDVRERWEERAAHGAFLALASSRYQLATAAALYRAEKAARPERADEADEQIAAIMVLATDALATTRRPPPRLRWLGAVISGVFLGVAAYIVKRVVWG